MYEYLYLLDHFFFIYGLEVTLLKIKAIHNDLSIITLCKHFRMF